MYDLLPFRRLHMSSSCVSWTHGPPAAHHLLAHPSHPQYHLTTASKRYFASPLTSQLSNIRFPISISPSAWAPRLSLPCTICSENADPALLQKDPRGAGCGSVTYTAFLQSSFSGHRWYKKLQCWAKTLYASTAQHRLKRQSWPPTMCLEASTHNNAVPHHAWYHL